MKRLPCLALMARAPLPGDAAVKSRLAPVLPDPAARIALYAAFVTDTLAACRRVSQATLRVAFTPPDAAGVFSALNVARDELLPQRGAGLGERERNLFADLFALGFDPVVIMGSDLPTLPAAHIDAALAALHEPCAALGPSEDGGYYLIGLRAPAPGSDVPDLFTGVRWSTADAFADTVAAAARAGLAVRRVPRWFDVDDPPALERLRRQLAADPSLAPATARMLRELAPRAANPDRRA